MAKAMMRAGKSSFDAVGQHYDLRQNRYRVELVKKGTYSEAHRRYVDLLATAMANAGTRWPRNAEAQVDP